MKYKNRVIVFFFLLQLTLAISVVLHAQVAAPAKYSLQKDLVYKTVGDWQGRLDVYMPDSGVNHPLLINIHGGGWVHGKKETETGFIPFFDKNFVIANVEYRLANQAKAPAAIEDTRCALLYLINNAKQFHIDPSKIIIMGGSAGGHLALMTGLLKSNAIFDANCTSRKPYRVAAIIDKYGPANLNTWDAMKKAGKASADWPGDRINDSVFLQSLSPVTYVRKNTPPIFIVHGDKDHTVAYSQSIELFERLKSVGATVEMYMVSGGMHGNFSLQQKEEIDKRIEAFISKVF